MRCEIDIKKFAYASAEGGGGAPVAPLLFYSIFAQSHCVKGVWLTLQGKGVLQTFWLIGKDP